MKKQYYLYITVIVLAFIAGFYIQESLGKETKTKLNLFTALSNTNLSAVDLVSASKEEVSLNKEYNLINFWATWCPPCIKELPLLNEVVTDCSDLAVIGFAFDELKRSQEFNQQLNLAFKNYVFGLQGVQLSAELDNPTGAMPYTILVNSQGEVLKQKIGPYANKEEIITFVAAENPNLCQ